MKISITEEFKDICREMIEMDHSLSEWDDIVSDDMFQSDHFCGGFESPANTFTFTYYDKEKREYWLEITLSDIRRVVDGKIAEIEVRAAE